MNFAARNIHEAAMDGFKRLRKFRAARLMFVQDYTGQYYNKTHGVVGDEPLNMAFTAIRALIPNLISRTPKTIVRTEFLQYRSYGELLALALNSLAKKIGLSSIVQRGLVDAIFTMGIFKVGLMTSNSLAFFGEEIVDPGQLYVDTVDFDDLTFDPEARRLDQAAFIGEKIRIEREELLQSGLYDNAIVERLPSCSEYDSDKNSATRNLSGDTARKYSDSLHDLVEALELWLPGPNALVTVPYKGGVTDKFMREEEFNGPADGPYAFLTLTPPVPDNPIPVQLAGIWHDLHTMGNRIAKKTLDQAEAQKDVLGYQRQFADDAQEIVDAKNLDAVAMQEPNAAQMFSFGGQNPRNEQMVAQLLAWFDQFSGNTSLLGGTQVQTNVATVANIMQTNASAGILYMRDMAYDAVKHVLEKCAWYLHTDPLIRLPLIKRDSIPAQYNITPAGVQMIAPAQVQESQVFFTPDVRRGDFLDFAFDIEQDSMAPINWQFRLQQLEVLAVRIIPAAAAAAQICAQMGTPFSFQAFVTRTAKMMNLDWIDEIFQSPELVAQMAVMAQMGPQHTDTKGAASPAGVAQNGGAVTAGVTPPQRTQERQQAQAGAAQGQAELPVREV
jgi:hypothetical protein